MTKFAVKITDEAQLAGIAAATAGYNATLPEGEKPLTEAKYVQFVMENAAQSYFQQYAEESKDAKIARLEEALRAKEAVVEQ